MRHLPFAALVILCATPAIAAAYCAGWAKYPRITSVRRQYGDYIAFHCLWNPYQARWALPAVRTRTTCAVAPERTRLWSK